MEVPSELFRVKNAKVLTMDENHLCSLPSEITPLTTLEELYVRQRCDRTVF